jgi:hypothetical protein
MIGAVRADVHVYKVGAWFIFQGPEIKYKLIIVKKGKKNQSLL